MATFLIQEIAAECGNKPVPNGIMAPATPSLSNKSGEGVITASNVFQFNGPKWTLHYGGLGLIEKNRVGLQYIYTLICRKYADVHSTQLVTKAYGEPVEVMKEADLLEAGVAIENDGEDDHASNPFGQVVTAEFQDEILSDDDRAYVLDLLDKAKEDLITARATGLIDVITEKEEEIFKIEEYLQKHRFKNRNIHFDGRSENDRRSVSKAIKEAIGKIEEKHPALAKHLRDSINFGVYCSYDPTPDVLWKR